MDRPPEPGSFGAKKDPLTEPPPNPKGGKTLIVDALDPGAYIRPSAALKDAGDDDQVFIAPASMKTRYLSQISRCSLWGLVETRCRFTVGGAGRSICNGFPMA